MKAAHFLLQTLEFRWRDTDLRVATQAAREILPTHDEDVPHRLAGLTTGALT